MYFYLLIPKNIPCIPCCSQPAIPVPLFMTGVGIFFANYFLSFFMSGDFIFATCKVCKLFLRIAKSLNVRSHLFVPDFFFLTPIF